MPTLVLEDNPMDENPPCAICGCLGNNSCGKTEIKDCSLNEALICGCCGKGKDYKMNKETKILCPFKYWQAYCQCVYHDKFSNCEDIEICPVNGDAWCHIMVERGIYASQPLNNH